MTSREFAEFRKRVNRLVDKLGRPIDRGILNTVTALCAYNINTIGSCAGHVGRASGGPYVMFEAPGIRKDREVLRAIHDRLSPEYKKVYNKATKSNIKEVQKVLKLLDEFYIDRLVPIDQRLIVRYFGPTEGILMCQGGYLEDILTRTERVHMLKKNQAEMRAFTDYLIAKIKTPRTI